MTQEEKELLFVDLCARLPYGVKVQYLTEGDKTYICNIDQVSIKSQCVGIAEIGHTVFTWRTIDRIKPYLRPMSSMTEDEKREIYNWLVENDVDWFDFSKLRLDEILISFDSSWLLVNWLLKNHFDYRGLIEKGLAIEAPKGMYN